MTINVVEQFGAQKLHTGTIYGVPTPAVEFDGSQGTYAARKMISVGDTAANTKLAQTRLLLASEDDIRELVTTLAMGAGSVVLRMTINPGDADTASTYLAAGYPNVYTFAAGTAPQITAHKAAIYEVYLVPVLALGSTLATTKGQFTCQGRTKSTTLDFADAPNSTLYRLKGSGSQTQSPRAGFPTDYITWTAASWDANNGDWAGNGAAYGTLPATFANRFTGVTTGDIIIVSLWARATSITSGKYYFGMGRATSGTGNKSGSINLQQTGSGPITLNWRKGAANDGDHTTNDVALGSVSSNSSTAQNFAWIINCAETTNEISVFTNAAFENSAQNAAPTGGLLYPYYDATAGGAVVGARITSGGPTEPLAAGEYMQNLFIGRYPGMSMTDAIAIVQSLYSNPAAYSPVML